MKSFLIILLLGLLPFVIWSQVVIPDESTLKELGLNNSDIETLLEFKHEANNHIRESSADMAVLKAQIRRELNKSSPSITESERLIREASDILLEIQLVKIQSNINIQNIVGQNIFF